MSKFRVPYPEERHPRVPFETQGETMTKQAFKNETDINWILHRYQKTGLIEHVNRLQGEYVDLGSSVDYHQASNMLLAAQEAFDSLPSSIRKRFDNDPGSFLAFVEDPKNAQEMVELGLAIPSKKVDDIVNDPVLDGLAQDSPS